MIAEALGGRVRIHAARTTALAESARKLHDMYPTSAAALGRVMTVDALMASDLKDPNARIVTSIHGDGPIGNIISQADGRGNVRGFADNPQVYLYRNRDGKLDVGMGVGHSGTLTVVKDLGLREPFTGVVQLQTGEIGDDFAYYFALSEQTPSVVAVGVLVDTDYSVRAAGGLLLQLMPDADEETIEAVEQIAHTMKPVSAYIDEGKTPEDIIRLLLPDAVILQHRGVQWHCGCSREHYLDALSMIQKEELEQMIHEDHGCEVTCQYCGKKYAFTEEELKEALAKKSHVEDRQHGNS